jgi:hypothetical protein
MREIPPATRRWTDGWIDPAPAATTKEQKKNRWFTWMDGAAAREKKNGMSMGGIDRSNQIGSS